jgi:glycosyltransferase involved in cell wall biosynthesis
VTALLVPPRDPPALAAALGRVVDDATLRRSLAGNARAASTRYDIRTCVAGMEALYDEVLAERGLQ